MIGIKRNWTAQEADNWTKEDWIAILLSPLIYILIALGVAGSLLLRLWGFLSLACSILLTAVMYWIIDPKLKKISSEYEKKQKTYLAELEKKTRWESSDG